MNRIKTLLKSILFLPPLLAILIAVLSFSMVAVTFLFNLKDSVIGYISYVASAYALVILVIGMPKIICSVQSRVNNSHLKKRIYSYPIAKRFFKDERFRTDFFLYQGMLINILYAGFKAVTALMYRSEWFGAIGAYYLVLALIRVFLVRGTRKRGSLKSNHEKAIYEHKIYRMTGLLMIVLDVAMTGMIVQMVWKNRSYEYPGTIIYLSALFSFYCLTVSIVNIVNMIKKRRKISPIHMAVRALNFAGALMSIFSLQTAMLSQFGQADDVEFRQLMNIVTGSAIMLFIIAMAIFIIIYSNKSIKKFQINNSQTKLN